MISHETKRILGTSGLLFVLALFVIGALHFPLTGVTLIKTVPGPLKRPAPSLLFEDKLSFSFQRPSFNQTLQLSAGAAYLWRLNVTAGSVEANLTNPITGIAYWSIGNATSDTWRLNGVGFASFNWTAPEAGAYLLNIRGLYSWQGLLWSGGSLSSACDVQVWDLHPLTVSFNFRTQS